MFLSIILDPTDRVSSKRPLATRVDFSLLVVEDNKSLQSVGLAFCIDLDDRDAASSA